MASHANDANAQNTAKVEAEQREATEYWGYLIKPDKCGTELFDRLLTGIAEVISKSFEPSESSDLTPTQIAAFYRAVGGNYDVLFVETPPTSISFIYRSLGAFHSLQPAPDDDGYGSPSIPALKKKGFVTWQTIQLLLGPEEHVPFLQNAVAQFDVVDPETGNLFPKVLPKECLPDRPDDAMEQWYEGVAARLKREAEVDAVEKEGGPRGPRVVVDDHGPRTSSEMSDGSMEEKHGAAKYFSDPLYRKSRHRPPFIRHFSKQSRFEDERDRGRLISSVRHMLNPLNPFNNRRRSLPGRYPDDNYSDEDATPIATPPPPPPPPRYVSHKRPHPQRRESTLSSTDSDSEPDRSPSRRRTPVLRNRRSHEPMPTSPREYFPAYYDDRRYSHGVPPARKEDAPPQYGPTKSPLFATQVAHLQANNYYDRRPTMSPRASYRPHSVRYTAPPEVDPPYLRDRDRDRDRDREREREKGEYEPPGGSGRHRRRSEEYPRERERSERTTRSHERVRDEWDERENRSRERERERERDGDRRRTHRYVAGVQDGVSGRRYPVEQPWQ